ncbi:hypothetical protein [Bacillus sp. JCM 19041]|uniref:hypothetical protein n=1 Tax=Bacillus sp. JCM 19041 TaxID=1460637 RepID=UPI0006D26BC3
MEKEQKKLDLFTEDLDLYSEELGDVVSAGSSTASSHATLTTAGCSTAASTFGTASTLSSISPR